MVIRIVSMLVLASTFICAAVPAGAKGTATVTKTSGSVKVYDRVRIRMLGATGVRITSADGRGSLTIHHAACSFTGDLQRCLPFEFTLDQFGQKHLVQVARGTLYFNATGAPVQMPRSSEAVPANGIVLGLQTLRGTIISVIGRVDK